MDKRELTTLLQDPASAMRRLLNVWSDIPILLMLDIDWDRGPLVLIGTVGSDDVASAAAGQPASVGFES